MDTVPCPEEKRKRKVFFFKKKVSSPLFNIYGWEHRNRRKGWRNEGMNERLIDTLLLILFYFCFYLFISFLSQLQLFPSPF